MQEGWAELRSGFRWVQLTPPLWWFDKIIPCRGPHDLLRAAPNSRQGDRGRLVEDTPGAGVLM
jgi:hypothetical protein